MQQIHIRHIEDLISHYTTTWESMSSNFQMNGIIHEWDHSYLKTNM